MPNLHAVVLLVVTLAVFYLYTRAWIRIELVSLLLLATLLLLFYVFPFRAAGSHLTEVDVFNAFGHPALIAICCLMVMGRGLTMTGALEPAVRVLGRLWRMSASLGLLVTLLVAGAASAFVNDTPVLVLLMPLLLGLAEKTQHPASKTLMPANFAILAGGMLTSIGTSTNLLVLSIAVDLGMKPIGVFDFTGSAIFAFVVALPYLWLIAPRLLPDRGSARTGPDRQYEARIEILDLNSRLAGRTFAELKRVLGRRLPVVAVTRSGHDIPLPTISVLETGDVLRLRDTPAGLREVSATFNADLFDRTGPGRFLAEDSGRVDIHLAEVVIGARSPLQGRSLRELRFAEYHGVVVVGLSRGTEGLSRRVTPIVDTPLNEGDILLAQGPKDRIDRLREQKSLLVLDATLVLPRSPLAPVAIATMAVVVALAATKLLPIHVAAFLGALAMLLTGCVRLEGVGRAISLEVVLLVASSLALGQALVTTGAAGWIAQGVAAAVAGVPPAMQLAIFMTFAALLTNFVSNAAAASVGTPIAVATAIQLGQPMEPYVLAILFGANLSYATPMAYQTNLLIMNAAGYRFSDFVRVGVPLVLLMLITLSISLVKHYGLA